MPRIERDGRVILVFKGNSIVGVFCTLIAALQFVAMGGCK